MAIATFWYPSIIWPGGRIDLDEVYRLTIPPKARIGSAGIAASGLQETCVDRAEVTVTLVLWPLTKTRVDELTAWWDTWALYGRSSQLILDRLNTCTTQAEYRYNTYFSRAILVTDPFAPTRQEQAISRPLYSIGLQFRQDNSGGVL